MATHWGIDGNANGFSTRSFAVFVPTAIVFAVHWLCILITFADPKNKGQNSKAMGIVFWISPLLSLFVNGIVYATAFGKEMSAQIITPVIFGIMFVVMGKYMPKIKQNYTIGVKVPGHLKTRKTGIRPIALPAKCGLLEA